MRLDDGGRSLLLEFQRDAPPRIGQSLTFSSLSIEGGNACAVGSDGMIYCWGYNAEGQVGDGIRKKRDTPVALRFQ